MIVLDSISLLESDGKNNDILTYAISEIINTAKSIVGTDEGVVVVTGGLEESLHRTIPKSGSVLCSFLEPISVSSLPNAKVTPVAKNGSRVIDTFLSDSSFFSAAVISLVNEEYGVLSDYRSLASIIKSISPATRVILDITHGIMDLCNKQIDVSDIDVVVCGGELAGAPYVGFIWSRDPGSIINNTYRGFQQFGLRSGHLCPHACVTLLDGMVACRSREESCVKLVTKNRHYLEKSILNISGIYLNFPEAPKASHTSNFYIEGVWTKPLILSLRKAGVFVSDCADAIRNTLSYSPLTSYMFEETARNSNVIFNLSPFVSESDIVRSIDYLSKAVDMLRDLGVKSDGF